MWGGIWGGDGEPVSLEYYILVLLFQDGWCHDDPIT